eukprot:8852055-Pyramimonas_sp.AAC.2
MAVCRIVHSFMRRYLGAWGAEAHRRREFVRRPLRRFWRGLLHELLVDATGRAFAAHQVNSAV